MNLASDFAFENEQLRRDYKIDMEALDLIWSVLLSKDLIYIRSVTADIA